MNIVRTGEKAQLRTELSQNQACVEYAWPETSIISQLLTWV